MNPTRSWPRLAWRVLKHAFTGWRDPLARGQLARALDQIGTRSLPLTLVVGTGGGFVIGTILARIAGRLGMVDVAPRLVWLVGPEYFAPVIAGVVVICRCVSSTAAELASMAQNEEVKAVAVMGVGVERYLLAPRWLAFVLATPALTVFALLAILAGSWLALAPLLDLSPGQFLRAAGDRAAPAGVLWGLLRSVIGGGLMGAVALGCGLGPCRDPSSTERFFFSPFIQWMRKYLPRGEAAGGLQINRATTRAVVGALLMMIGVQLFFAFLALS